MDILHIILIISLIFGVGLFFVKRRNKSDGTPIEPRPPRTPVIPDIDPENQGDVNNGETFNTIAVGNFRNPNDIVESSIQLLSNGNVLIKTHTPLSVKTFIARSRWLFGDFPRGIDASMYKFTALNLPSDMHSEALCFGPSKGNMGQNPTWNITNSVVSKTSSCQIYVNIEAPEDYTSGIIVLNLIFEDLR